jgi:hypothetical protein
MSRRIQCSVAALLAGAFCVVSSANAQAPAHEEKPEVASAADRVFLKDAIDVHTHLDPDSFGPHSGQQARALDVMDMGRRAKAAGMRGFVIKQHYDQTAALAYLVDKEVPGVEAFGQLCLNLTVGGLNPEAVHHFGEVKGGLGRIVSMPTWDSENGVKKSRTPNRASVSVSKDGQLLPETVAVIKAIAEAKIRDSDVKLALATGHISPEEGLMVIREAKKQGIARIMVTHAMGPPVGMNLAQMKEAVAMGAYIEFVGGMVQAPHRAFTPQQYLDAMRAVGLDHVILSSDSGQVGRAFPDDTLAMTAGQLRALGMTPAELHQIMVDNPAKLLGLPPKA